VIAINDRYAIKSDEYQWMLCVRRSPSKSNPSEWAPKKFYTRLPALAAALHGILLRTSDYSSLSDLEHNAHEISAMINARLEYGSREG
jgi:hypothetical protein